MHFLAYAESSLSVVTALAPTIGYEKAATIAREAMRQGRSIKEVARDLRVVPTDEVDRLCDVTKMTGAGLYKRDQLVTSTCCRKDTKKLQIIKNI